MENLRYDPDQDPLIQRARSRGPRGRGYLILAVIGLVGWIVYSDVGPKFMGKLDTETGPKIVSRPVDVKNTEPGPYHVGWTKGQTSVYGFSTRMEGKGSPSLTGSTGLNMGFDADFRVTAEDVDKDGNTTLLLAFDCVNMSGNFLGYPVDLRKRDAVTQSYVPETVAPVQTALNKKFQPPSPDVFDAPIRVKLDSKGVGVGAETGNRLDRLVLTILRLSGSAFPASSLQVGDTWENDYDIEWPGMKAPLTVHVTTMLAEEAEYWGRKCGCFTQQITPGASRDKLLAKFGRIDISGQSRFYFDQTEGRTIYFESELIFDLILNAGLEAAAETFGIYTGLLEDIEGGQKFDMKAAAENKEKAGPIGFIVRSTIALKG